MQALSSKDARTSLYAGVHILLRERICFIFCRVSGMSIPGHLYFRVKKEAVCERLYHYCSTSSQN